MTTKKPAKKVVKSIRSPGRPTKFTEEVRAKILLAVRGGNYIETAAAYAGINKDTFYNWMNIAESPDAPKEYSEFYDAIKEARAMAEVRSVALIGDAANGGAWQAAAWYLERSYPARFGRTRIEVTGADSGPVRVEVDADALEAKVRELVAKESDKSNP